MVYSYLIGVGLGRIMSFEGIGVRIGSTGVSFGSSREDTGGSGEDSVTLGIFRPRIGVNR